MEQHGLDILGSWFGTHCDITSSTALVKLELHQHRASLEVGNVFFVTCWATTHTSRSKIYVAKDGTGDFYTIGEAVAAAPNYSKTPTDIMIKKGVYLEYIIIETEKTNIAFIGDGMHKTVISGNRSSASGLQMDQTATVAIFGVGFIAKGISFKNTAGLGHQAVALKSNVQSAFYKCSFHGYQDTLYTKHGRQFYRDCVIYGKTDFIYGNAAVVFQNCFIIARNRGGTIITAQGREGPYEKGGTILHNCTITYDHHYRSSSIKTYLGRPWQLYSRVVVMQSFIDDFIDPKGWLNIKETNLDKLFYAEYKNRGRGANTTGRVKWPGYKVFTEPNEVLQFTVNNFIQGNEWIPSTGIPFIPGLL
ncbi:pectinesterase-like [Impatiens glandulifera]|uniref:pectinesterase-like n=1 Tax=Impatiens glandulifera TaxID=253017 RepID=UPI001FB0C642|nr:pectinesterase-like [Impatiens glandulifera]